MLEILSFSDRKRAYITAFNENERANFGGGKKKKERKKEKTENELNAVPVVVFILESKALYSRTRGIIFYLLNMTRLHC